MTDAEAHEYVVRTDAFIDDIFELLTNTQPVNPNAGSSWWRSRIPSTPSTTSTFAIWRRLTRSCTVLYWMHSDKAHVHRCRPNARLCQHADLLRGASIGDRRGA